ncbi:MAG: PepSY domain-containing protein [Parvularculaceae bacterium]
MTFRRIVQSLHRWLGLLIALQILLWMTSGVIMSWFAIELVRGETTSAADFSSELAVQRYFSPGGIVAQLDGVTEVTLTSRHGRNVYTAQTPSGAVLFDADTGERLPPITEAQVRLIATRDFVGDGKIAEVDLLRNPPHEYRGVRPVWRVSFDDRDATRLYIAPSTGEVVSRRNRIWRLYDFFWMLHIMDYDERENFNNPLIKTFSATGFLFALSGLFLVLTRLRSGRYADDVKKAAAGAKSKSP